MSPESGNIVIESEPDRRVLETIRLAFGMRRLAFLAPDGNGLFELRALLGDGEKGDAREGGTVRDLGAAASVLSGGSPAVFNPQGVMPLRTPYSSNGVPSAGAMAVPFMGGVLWADRRDRPVSDVDFDGFVSMCALLEAASGNARDQLAQSRLVEYLSGILEGLRGVLTSVTEQECVGRLVGTAARQTGAVTGLAALLTGRDEATIVGGYGPEASGMLGATFDISSGLMSLAIRTGAAVPSGFRFSRRMRPVLGKGLDLAISENDGLIVHPMGPMDDPVGALLLAGGDFERPFTAHGVRTLCDCAALLLQRFRMQARMERDAMMDGLTGLYNRQAFIVRLSETFAFCKRHGHDLSLLMVDADRFKLVNDTYGHLVGDR
ncbi:MAG: GGDEF domain-containing protein, partial [Deltaproteobacteria bacterium]|nr:GGDEF domain-containing protein [Deltaproteobacteria bacterium]